MSDKNYLSGIGYLPLKNVNKLASFWSSLKDIYQIFFWLLDLLKSKKPKAIKKPTKKLVIKHHEN